MSLPALAGLFALGHQFALVFNRPVCRCECSGGHIDRQIVEVLRGQLDRCGPANLTSLPCPPCPIAIAEGPTVTLLLLAWVGGCFSGLLFAAASGLWCWHGGTSAVPPRAAVVNAPASPFASAALEPPPPSVAEVLEPSAPSVKRDGEFLPATPSRRGYRGKQLR